MDLGMDFHVVGAAVARESVALTMPRIRLKM
jgi:hypothetical protein